MTRRDLLSTVPGLVTANTVAFGLDGVAADHETAEVQARIQRVENGLRPEPLLRYSSTEAAALSDRMAAHKVPGLSISVIHDYKVEWVRNYGVSELGRTEPLTTQTLFQAGSISKPVTAIAALRLAAQGKLDLDEDVNRYLTSWKVPANDGWQPRITVRQLITHTAGTTVHGFAGYPVGHRIPTLLQVLDGASPANSAPVVVDTIPGIQSRYSGGGYCIVQQVLIDVLKKPFPQIMRELVLDPALMSASGYEQPPPVSRARYCSCGHRSDGEKVPGGSHIYPEMAPAGLWTTSADLAKFVLQLQLASAQRPNNLLSPKDIAEVFAPHGEPFQGFGVALSGQGENARFSHRGWDEGFVSNFVAYQHKGIGAVIMANADQGGAEIEPEILRSIAKEYDWPEYEESTPQTIEPVEATLRSVVGTYELPSGFRLIVRKQNGQVVLAAGDQPAMKLSFTSADKAFASAVNADMVFTTRAGGSIAGLKIKESDKEFTAKKLA